MIVPTIMAVKGGFRHVRDFLCSFGYSELVPEGRRLDESTGSYDPSSLLVAVAAQPVHAWPTPALVIRLDRLAGEVATAPQDAALRLNTSLAAVRELTDRGIDGESFVRYGLLDQLTGLSAIVFLMHRFRWLSAGEEVPDFDAAGWSRYLGVEYSKRNEMRDGDNEIPNISRSEIYGILPKIRKWVTTAPIEDVFTLRPPALEYPDTGGAPEVSLPDGVQETYCWLRDRYCETELRSWRRSSVKMEYSWLRGFTSPRFNEAHLSFREVSLQALALRIADDATSSVGSVGQGESGALIHQLQRQAKGFLTDGRYREAAALFEFLGKEAGDDETVAAVAANNQGFCLLPVDPPSALHHLERAKAGGYSETTILAFNLMCAHWAVGDLWACRTVCEAYWLEEFESSAPVGTIWTRGGDGKWQLEHAYDVRIALAEFALEIAIVGGWADRTQRWQIRLDSLRSGSYVL